MIKKLPVNQKQKVVLIVASKRIEGFAKEYGFKNSVLSESPHDKEMVEAALAEAWTKLFLLSIPIATFHGAEEFVICFGGFQSFN